jgi:hypothetical protein
MSSPQKADTPEGGMNVQTRFSHRRRRKPSSSRVLGACLGAAGIALVAGCSVAPPGSTSDSPAVGPVRTSANLDDFAPFPVPAVWGGEYNVNYQVIVKAKTGTKLGGFRFIVRTGDVFWLNCIGAGSAQFTVPALGVKWSVPCGDGDNPQGITVHPKTSAVGHGAQAYVSVTPGSRWEVRIDGEATSGVAPVPDQIPKR